MEGGRWRMEEEGRNFGHVLLTANPALSLASVKPTSLFPSSILHLPSSTLHPLPASPRYRICLTSGMARAPNKLPVDLLRDVSRTFYTTLNVLPKSIRMQIGLAYLLAR